MSQIYEIGMKIALTNGVSSVIGVIIADMVKLEGYQKRIAAGFSGMNLAIMGMGAAIAGSGILTVMAKVASHGDKLLDQQDKLQGPA